MRELGFTISANPVCPWFKTLYLFLLSVSSQPSVISPYFFPMNLENLLKLLSSITFFYLASPSGMTFFFFFINLFIYLFLAALGLCCCAWAFSSCGEQGLLFVAVHRLLIVVASLVVEHGLSSCGSRALERRLSSCGAGA